MLSRSTLAAAFFFSPYNTFHTQFKYINLHTLSAFTLFSTISLTCGNVKCMIDDNI